MGSPFKLGMVVLFLLSGLVIPLMPCRCGWPTLRTLPATQWAWTSKTKTPTTSATTRRSTRGCWTSPRRPLETRAPRSLARVRAAARTQRSLTTSSASAALLPRLVLDLRHHRFVCARACSQAAERAPSWSARTSGVGGPSLACDRVYAGYARVRRNQSESNAAQACTFDLTITKRAVARPHARIVARGGSVQGRRRRLGRPRGRLGPVAGARAARRDAAGAQTRGGCPARHPARQPARSARPQLGGGATRAAPRTRARAQAFEARAARASALRACAPTSTRAVLRRRPSPSCR